jgi:hypothetical protein
LMKCSFSLRIMFTFVFFFYFFKDIDIGLFPTKKTRFAN